MLLHRNRTIIAKENANYDFDYINSVEVRSSWDSLTDTATLMLPKKITYKNAFGVETQYITGEIPIAFTGTNANKFPVFQQGDTVSLSGGYGDDVPEVFSGYIRAIASNYPIKIDFEDAMYWLKNIFIEKKTFKNASLLEVVQFITKDCPIDIKLNVVDGVEIAELRISSVTAAYVLDHIKETYGLVSWFRGNTLNVGLAYLSENPSEVTIHRFFASGKDVNIISTENLEWKSAEQVKIKLKLISMYNDNTKKEVTVGDLLDGELRTYYVWGVKESSLEQMANQMLNKKVYDGYVGYFTTFLLPLVKHGDAVKLSDPDFPEREGTYLVKEVVYNYGVDGGRQKITLDTKIA